MRSARAFLVAAAAAAAFIAIEISLTGAWSVITRPLWLDEIHTLLLAGRGDLSQSLQALRAGAETNAPALFLLYRFVGEVTGGLSEIPMRLVAAASVIAALSLVYLLLRDELGTVPAASGALALWAQPVIVSVAFGARFYGPWLAGAAGLLLVLRRAVKGPWSWGAALVLAALSAFVCTIHYFGVLSWAAGVAAALVLARADLPNVARRLLPALAGPLALAACIPLYLGQRAALPGPTWVPKASLADHLFLLVATLIPLSLVVALGAWVASRLVRRAGPPGEKVLPATSLGVGSFLLLSQVAVALGVVMISLLVQPATQPRYWVPASLAVAPVVALAVSRSVRPLQLATLVAIVVASATFVSGEGAEARAFAQEVRVDSTYAERAASEGTPIVARRRHTLYPMLRAAPRVTPNAILFGGPSLGQDSTLVMMDLRIARVHHRFYGFPRIAGASELEVLPSFYFIELDSARSPSAREFPGRAIDRVAPRLFLIH
jgi:hypothetical protein